MNILLISRLTLSEAVRKRVLLLGGILTAVYLGLYGTGVKYAMEGITDSISKGHTPGGIATGQMLLRFEASMLLTLGLFVASMMGALVAVFSACGAISSEVEQGLLQTVIARPISRTQVVLGKWLGQVVLVGGYLLTLYTALVGIIYTFSGWHPQHLTAAGASFAMEAVVVATIALLGSTFLPTVANAVAVVMLFMTSLVGGTLEQMGVLMGKKALYTIGVYTGLIVPTDTLYRYTAAALTPRSDGISTFFPTGAVSMGPFGAASPPSVWMLAYAVFFCGLTLLAATVVFNRRDL